MQASEMRRLYNYHYWAMEHILEATRTVTGSQLTSDPPNSLRSLREILVHTISADWVWRERWEGRTPEAPLASGALATLDAIEDRWREEQAALRAFTASLVDSDLQRTVRYRTLKGVEHSSPLWQLMLHTVNHGTQHLAEAAVLLTDYGRSPGDIDLIYYLRGL